MRLETKGHILLVPVDCQVPATGQLVRSGYLSIHGPSPDMSIAIRAGLQDHSDGPRSIEEGELVSDGSQTMLIPSVSWPDRIHIAR